MVSRRYIAGSVRLDLLGVIFEVRQKVPAGIIKRKR